jgi:putative flavoprotein involved in K+ transport
VQIAAELAASGRDVTIAAGPHRRVPRRYRGRDIMRWLDALGVLDWRPDDEAARRRLVSEPSLQLDADGDLDLGTLAGRGVTVAGRLVGVADGRVSFDDDLGASVADAERRLRRLLDRIDHMADDLGVAPSTVDVPELVLGPGPASLPVGAGGIDAVVWATGFRRSYPWLHAPAFDERGEIRHDRGCTPIPGLYVIGMPFQSGRRSTYIDGARIDAPIVADAIDRRRVRQRSVTAAVA